MINLLGADDRRQLRASRLNVILGRYVLLLLVLAVFITGALAYGKYLLMQEEQTAIRVSEQYIGEKNFYAADVQKGTDFSKDLATAKSILTNEIFMSDVAFAISQTLPSQSVIRQLDLTSASLNEPMTLEILTTSYEDAVITKDAFEKSEYFENSIINTTSLLSEPDGRYTTELSLNVTLTVSKLTGRAQ